VVLGAVIPPTSPKVVPVPFTIAETQKVGIHVRSVRADGRISNPQQLTMVVVA
jgi:hypothetical protein